MNSIELDKQTLAYGPIAKYYDATLLKSDLDWYRSSGYELYELDASKWYTIDDFHSSCHEIFEFPGYYGRNWGAFDDVISDIETGENGKVLVCVANFDSWYKRDPSSAQIFLEIMADQTYSYLVGGSRFVTLIHSNDPKFNVGKVGAKRVDWNWSEWNDKSRGV